MVTLSKYDWDKFCVFCEDEFKKNIIEKHYQEVTFRSRGRGGRGRGGKGRSNNNNNAATGDN